MSLADLLAQAYHRDQVEHRTQSAIDMVRTACHSDPALQAEAIEKRDSLSRILKARGRRADHVGTVMFDLLAAALGG
jgi:hypothetical protein